MSVNGIKNCNVKTETKADKCSAVKSTFASEMLGSRSLKMHKMENL